MKRIITLLMAAVMVIGTAGLASAVEFKASGHMHLLFGVKDNDLETGFNKDVGEDNFYAAQRFRPKLTMKAEGVTAVFEAQQHQKYWGSDWPVGGNHNADVRIRQAYLQFKLPSTPVELKVGYQQLNLPSIWGHPVFEARVGAAMATIPFNDQVALAVFYARPADDLKSTSSSYVDAAGITRPGVTATAEPQDNSTDMFGALLPLNFGSVKATPYFVYAKVGTMNNVWTPGVGGAAPTYSGESWNDRLMVGGVNVEILPTDALSLKFDAIVTNHKSDGPTGYDAEAKTGWMLATAIDYELPWGTPGFFAWYATGDDEDGEKGLFSVKTDGFGPTTWGFEGYNTFDYGAQVGTSGRATWGIGLQIADMSFVDSLKHTVRVAYIQGTSDKDIKVAGVSAKRPGIWESWTEKDSFIEFNIDSTWSMYENLAAVVELGGLIPDLGSTTKDAGFEDDFAWRAQLTLRFSF